MGGQEKGAVYLWLDWNIGFNDYLWYWTWKLDSCTDFIISKTDVSPENLKLVEVNAGRQCFSDFSTHTTNMVVKSNLKI